MVTKHIEEFQNIISKHSFYSVPQGTILRPFLFKLQTFVCKIQCKHIILCNKVPSGIYKPSFDGTEPG